MIVDVEKLLAVLDIPVLSVDDDEIRGKCPMHAYYTEKKDSLGDWNINIETSVHHCFSCHFSGNGLSLVEDVLGMNRWEALTFLSANDLMSLDGVEFIPTPIEERHDEVLGESELVLFDEPPVEELEGRKISSAAARYYGIAWDSQKGSWVLPIRREDGKLLGYQLKRKHWVRNYPEGVKKRMALFGYDRHDSDMVVVLESPLDVARLYTVTKEPMGVAVFGSDVSSQQRMLLADLADHIVLAFDNDRAGERARDSFINLSHRVRISTITYDGVRPGVKDVGDMSASEIRRVLGTLRPLRDVHAYKFDLRGVF